MVQLALVALTAFLVVQGVQAWRGSQSAGQVSLKAAPGDILMVSSLTCPICAQAKRWLAEHRVPYAVCEIEQEPACAAAYTAMGAPGTPTFVVRGQRIVGFDTQRIADALR